MRGRGPCVRASVRPCVRASVRPCVRASVRPCVRASVRPCVRASVRPCVRASVRPCVRASVRPCVRASARPRVRASARPRVRASVLSYIYIQSTFTADWHNFRNSIEIFTRSQVSSHPTLLQTGKLVTSQVGFYDIAMIGNLIISPTVYVYV